MLNVALQQHLKSSVPQVENEIWWELREYPEDNDDTAGECGTSRKMRSLHGPPGHTTPGDAALPKEVNLRLDGFNRQEAASATLGHLATNADFTGYVVQDGWR